MLTVYIVSAASGLVLFYLPMLFKVIAAMRDGKRGDLEDSITGFEKAINAAKRKGVSSEAVGTVSVLNEILRIQGEQLQQKKNLITMLETRFGMAAGSAAT